MDLARYIRNIPDFPCPGVLFRDITPLLKDDTAFKAAINEFVTRYKGKPVDLVAAIESRGFIFGSALAYALGIGFVPIRKSGKLPWATLQMEYELEYGTAKLEIHKDAFKPGDSVLVIDDVIATGGSLEASCKLVESLGAKVFEVAVLIELTALGGRERLKGYNLFSIIKF